MNFTSHDLSVFEIYGIWKQSKVVSKAKQTQNYWRTNVINSKLSRQIWTPPLCNPPPNVIWSPWPRHVLLMIGHLQVLSVITINIMIVIASIAMIGQLQNITIKIQHGYCQAPPFVNKWPANAERRADQRLMLLRFLFLFLKNGGPNMIPLICIYGTISPGRGKWSKGGIFLVLCCDQTIWLFNFSQLFWRNFAR